MSQWVITDFARNQNYRLSTGAERAPGVTPGLPAVAPLTQHRQSAGGCCPTHVFSQINGTVSADTRRCIHCYRCVRGIEHPAVGSKLTNGDGPLTKRIAE